MWLLLIFKLLLLFASIFCQKIGPKDERSDSTQCFNRVYRNCNHDINFTEEELENARLFIQNRFLTETSIKPVKPPCSKLYVRKDFKCLTHEEKMTVVNVFKELFNNGVMDRFTQIHARYWPQTHKANEGALWHRWFLNEFEKEMRKINPDISLPYWETAVDFAAPEKSIVWDYFGHAGNKSNGYCVADGPFANQMVRNKEFHCLRRQWNDEQTLPYWGPPEYDTAVNQLSHGSWLLLMALSIPSHFKYHLSVGGFAGDMSIDVAPNDPIFYLFHNYQTDYLLFRWQLSNSEHLVPKSYNNGWKIDSNAKKISKANIETDNLIHYNNISIKEAFQVGFGEQCWVHDRNVKSINRLIKGIKNEVPIYFKRLPRNLLKKYYPRFYSGNFTEFDLNFSEVENCNNDSLRQRCRPMPLTQPFLSTANGRRQMKRFASDANLDISLGVLFAETLNYDFMADMLKARYCSPFA